MITLDTLRALLIAQVLFRVRRNLSGCLIPIPRVSCFIRSACPCVRLIHALTTVFTFGVQARSRVSISTVFLTNHTYENKN